MWAHLSSAREAWQYYKTIREQIWGNYRFQAGAFPLYAGFAPNLSAARAFAFAASSSLFLGGAVVSSERRSRIDTPATSSTAAKNDSSFAFDGLLKPLIFLTNCSEAARTSSSVTGGSKLKSVLIFLHMNFETSE